MTGSLKWFMRLLEVFLIIIALVFLYPIILIFYNSFKSYGEILFDIVSLPKKLDFGNYVGAWITMNYPKAFFNTLVLTMLGTAGTVVIGAMAGYKLSRVNNKLSGIIFALCSMPMMIPFQSIMISLVQEAKGLHLTGSLTGTSVLYWGINAPFVLFLYHGFTKTVPVQLDESAKIDGCGPFRTFFNIIFPVMKPLTVTVIIMNVTLIWNDFILPLLTLSSNQEGKTLQLAAYAFFGQYVNDWNLALAGAVMIITPSMIIFIVFQKYIMKGVAAGAVKG